MIIRGPNEEKDTIEIVLERRDVALLLMLFTGERPDDAVKLAGFFDEALAKNGGSGGTK